MIAFGNTFVFQNPNQINARDFGRIQEYKNKIQFICNQIIVFQNIISKQFIQINRVLDP